MAIQKKSFFKRMLGHAKLDSDEEDVTVLDKGNKKILAVKNGDEKGTWAEEVPEEGELTVDVYQTPGEIVVQTMVAGVRPEDLQVTITRDMITVKGKREENKNINEENYFTKELYWGTFSRTILLPQEIDPEEAEAIEKHGLLVIKLPKVDKDKRTSVRVKSI